MNVAEAIASRRSIRAFKSSAVEEEKLKRVLEAGRLSPSARNVQDRKFVVVRDKSTREKLMKAAKNHAANFTRSNAANQLSQATTLLRTSIWISLNRWTDMVSWLTDCGLYPERIFT